MIKIKNKANCCGCTACESVCAHDAITMQPDAMGFLYPVVDSSKCVECGLCEKVCAFNEHYDTSLNLPLPDAYAARHKDMNEVETSRSGAAFIAISDYILEQGGVVYGAGYTDHFRVIHKRAATKEERNEFKGSKYVQSDLRGIFRQVKQDLKNGLIVLFSGTPCQTAGLNSFIGKKLRERLILVDIVCHGVPSPYVWRDYLAYLEEKQGAEICWVNFRDKQEFGWAAHKETFKFVNMGGGKMSFTTLFYKHIIIRKSCGKCPYTNMERPSDITLADFWGWEKTDMKINKDNKGVSLVLVNTEKGREIFDKVKHRMTVVPAELVNCEQPNLKHPTKIHPKHKAFEKDYVKYGFEYAYMKYDKIENPSKANLFIKKLGRKCSRIIRKLAGKL